MAKVTRRLGRGLSSLVANLKTPAAQSAEDAVIVGGTPPSVPIGAAGRRAARDSRLASLPVDALVPNPFQPRRAVSDDSVASLAESIESNGLIQPIVVRSTANGYQIITGERRWTAAKLLGRKSVPVVVREATDAQMLELALVENIQREELNAIDRARAYRNYCDHFGASAEQISQKTGEDRTTVLNYLRILELPDKIQGLVAGGDLSMGHARCLLAVADKQRQVDLAGSIVQHQLSVRAVEEIVRREKTRAAESTNVPSPLVGGAPPPMEPAQKSPHLRDIESRFEEVLKTKTTIKESRRKHHGRIVIEYYSLEDFERIATALGVELD